MSFLELITIGIPVGDYQLPLLSIVLMELSVMILAGKLALDKVRAKAGRIRQGCRAVRRMVNAALGSIRKKIA